MTPSAQPQDVLWVGNGFSPDWMPGGYRDVKVNPVVNGHLCEIQLQLGAFFSLKDGQHEVYRWSRELNVTTEMKAEHLFKNLSREVTKEMIRLAQRNWRGTEYLLPSLHLNAGDYLQAQKVLNKVRLRVQLMPQLAFVPFCWPWHSRLCNRQLLLALAIFERY